MTARTDYAAWIHLMHIVHSIRVGVTQCIGEKWIKGLNNPHANPRWGRSIRCYLENCNATALLMHTVFCVWERKGLGKGGKV